MEREDIFEPRKEEKIIIKKSWWQLRWIRSFCKKS